MANKGKKKGNPNVGPVAVLVVGAVALLGLFGWAIVSQEKTDKQQQAASEMQKPNQYGCTPSGAKNKPAGVETVPCKSANHVPEGTQVKYESDPPLSGDHYPSWVNPGFYDKPQNPQMLVHSLEHGHVVIYFDPAKVSAEQQTYLKSLTDKYKGNWDGVEAVARPGSTHPIILTAWENALRLDAFDQARIDSFVDAFRGRGPENPVRF